MKHPFAPASWIERFTFIAFRNLNEGSFPSLFGVSTTWVSCLFKLKKIRVIFSIAVLLLLYSCGESTPKCLYGSPTPIFTKDLKMVTAHQFSANGQNATETVAFSNGLNLEVLQGGCNSINQEFRFTVPGKKMEDAAPYWIAMSIDLFHFLGELSEKYMIYHQYGNVLEEKGVAKKLGEEINVGEGVIFQVDRIAGTDQNLVIIKMAQGTEH